MKIFFLLLIQNISLLVSLIFIDSLFLRRMKSRKAPYNILSGILFGCVALIGMIMPVRLFEGIIFDGRSIIISVAGFFGGPIVALISAAICGVYRFIIGGAGKWMGVSVIAESAIIGIVFYYLRKRYRWTTHPLGLYLFGILVHIAMLALTNLLPAESAAITLKQIWLPVITIYPAASLIVCLMFLDMEKRLTTETKLRESEEQYRNYVRNSPLGVVITKPDGTLADANPKAFEIAGIPTEELSQIKLTGILRPDFEELAAETYSNISEQNAINFEAIIINNHGKEIWCSFSAVRLKDERILWFVEDISAKKESEEERFEIQRRILHVQKLESLGILAGGIAHDFNNILTAALGNVDLALHEIPKNSPVIDELTDVRISILRAAELSRQMLAYSGKGKFISETLDLNAVIRSMHNLLTSTISKKVTLKMELADGLPKFTGDSTQVSQVVMNLTLNASESIDKNDGRVTIKTSTAVLSAEDIQTMPLFSNLAEGEYLSIEVSDNGIGMDEETIQKIFEPFFTTKFTGRGLGMSVVLGIVKGHKGAIKIQSNPNEGTTFKVYFPILTITDEARNDNRESPAGVHDSAGSVLFADDEESIRSFVKKVLTKENVSHYCVANGIEAIDCFLKNRDAIRLIILDLTMPQMGGEDSYREIRKIDPNVKVIITSGYTEQEIVGKFDNRIEGFIQKPFTYQKLINAVRKGLTG